LPGFGHVKWKQDSVHTTSRGDDYTKLKIIQPAPCASGKSLLPIGVVDVIGEFERGAAVACLSPQGDEVARGLINYGSSDSRRIARRASQDIEVILGYIDEAEIIHRDNLVLS
jgi:glutamate 5-kinase